MYKGGGAAYYNNCWAVLGIIPPFPSPNQVIAVILIVVVGKLNAMYPLAGMWLLTVLVAMGAVLTGVCMCHVCMCRVCMCHVCMCVGVSCLDKSCFLYHSFNSA